MRIEINSTSRRVSFRHLHPAQWTYLVMDKELTMKILSTRSNDVINLKTNQNFSLNVKLEFDPTLEYQMLCKPDK